MHFAFWVALGWVVAFIFFRKNGGNKLIDVFNNLSHYCTNLPRLDYTKIKGKKFTLIVLETRTYPVLNILYDLFTNNGKKIIKEDLFYFITPTSLAYLIMSDGVSNQYGLTICTDSFSIKEVIILSSKEENILKIKFDLNTSLHFYNNKPRIYFPAATKIRLKELISPYMIPFQCIN